MCYGCWEEGGKPSIRNEKTIEAAALIDKIYEFSLVGGNAHVVVDDWNLNDENIQWCLNLVNEGGHHVRYGNRYNDPPEPKEQLEVEKKCLEALLALTMDERFSAMAISREFDYVSIPNE